MSEEVKELQKEVEELKKSLNEERRSKLAFKCRNDTFRTSSSPDLLKHIMETGHKDYALIEGNLVIVDWIKIERTSPS